MSRHVQQLMAAQLAMSTESLVADATQLDTYLEEAAGACAALESIDLSLAALADGNVTTAAIEAHVDTFLAEQNLTVSNEGVADKLKTAGAAIWKKLKELIAWIVDLFKKIGAKIKAWIASLQPQLKKLKLKAKDLAGKAGEVSFEVSQETANWVRDPKVMNRSFLIIAPGKTAIHSLVEVAGNLAEHAIRSDIDNPKVGPLWNELDMVPTYYHGRLLPTDAYVNYELSSDPADDHAVEIWDRAREISASMKIKPIHAEAYTNTSYTVPVRQVLAGLDAVSKHLGPWEAEIHLINTRMDNALQAIKRLVANPEKVENAPYKDSKQFAEDKAKTALAIMQLIQKLSHTVQVGIFTQRSFTEHHIKWLNAAFAAAK